MLHLGGWHGDLELSRHDPLYLQATTACLSGIIVSQIVNVFICRSSWSSVVKLNPLGNRLLVFGVIVEIGLILLIDYTPVGNLILGTAPIPLTVWLFMIPFAIAMLALEEFRKLLVRRFSAAARRRTKPCT